MDIKRINLMEHQLISSGKRIAELRNKRKLTQEKLAELTDYTANHIAKLESARTNPSYPLLVAISKALKVEMCELFDFEEHKSPEYVRKEFEKCIKSADDTTIKILYKFYKSLY